MCSDEAASFEGKLATGSLIKEVERKSGRLQYELLKGCGPACGWVASSMLAKVHDCGGRVDPEACRRLNEKSYLASEPSEEEMQALRMYQEKFGEARDGARKGFDRRAFPLFSPQGRSGAANPEAIDVSALTAESKKKERKPRLKEVDEDGEEIKLCAHCSLPVGEIAYPSKQCKDACVHAECRAQIMLQELRDTEERTIQGEKDKKLASRFQHSIGWGPGSIPLNSPIAKRLGHEILPNGLCCLVYDEATRTVKLAATHEPSAAVNLEYLLLALKVRKTAGREPLFSLEPVNHTDIQNTPQKKIFEPAWLQGTSVGEVMFQADYYLKELALGEYTMPVVGMPSVFDVADQTGAENWSGREWFVVKQAEIRIAEDKTLIPHVRMGVEAREQILVKGQLEDAPITSPNSPLKRFAEAFTRNYDVVAERKSVIFHLRELAKASVMAKFIVDSKTQVDPFWYAVADEIVRSTKPDEHIEIPQLWNMRGNQRIRMKDGKLLDEITGVQKNVRAIFGGVEFGLDRFELAQRAGLPGAPLGQPGAPGAPAVPLQQAGFPRSMQLGPSGRPMFMPQRFQISQRGETPQGVDLNLDKFGLSTVDRFHCLPPCSASFEDLEGRVTLGKAFLKSLQDDMDSRLTSENQVLLQKVYNPAVCDRAEEGDAFVPPDPCHEYVARIRNLVKQEQTLAGRRRAAFSSPNFQVGNAGLDFPRSWTSRVQILQVGKSVPTNSRAGLSQLQVTPEFEKHFFADVAPLAVPDFKEATEDAMFFRIYRIGSLEVRTVQEFSKDEVIAAVFSRSSPTLVSSHVAQALQDGERLIMGKLYVEAHGVQSESGDKVKTDLDKCHYYMVLETNRSNIIVTEKAADGSISWVVNPKNIEDRVSLSKFVKQRQCNTQVTAQQLQNLQSRCRAKPGSFAAKKKHANDIMQALYDGSLPTASKPTGWQGL